MLDVNRWIDGCASVVDASHVLSYIHYCTALGRCHETNQFFALKVFSKRRFKTIGEMRAMNACSTTSAIID